MSPPPHPLHLHVSTELQCLESIASWDFLARTKLIPGYVRHSATAAVQRGAQGVLSLSHSDTLSICRPQALITFLTVIL